MAARTGGKAPLRVVEPGESTSQKRPMTILEAAESGCRLDELVAMRRRIARACDDPNIRGADLAALTRRQLEISKEIESITAATEGDEVGNAAETPDEEWSAN